MEHLGISWKHVIMFSLSGLILGFGGPNCWLRVLPCHILKYSRGIDIFVVKSLISKIFPMPLERTPLCQRSSFVLSECSKSLVRFHLPIADQSSYARFVFRCGIFGQVASRPLNKIATLEVTTDVETINSTLIPHDIPRSSEWPCLDL